MRRIPLEYTSVELFSEKAIMVDTVDGIAIADLEGNLLSEDRWSYVQKCKDGFAKTRMVSQVDSVEYCGIIDSLGQIVIQPVWDSIGEEFETGYVWVMQRDVYGRKRYGLVNQQDELVVPCEYDSVEAAYMSLQ